MKLNSDYIQQEAGKPCYWLKDGVFDIVTWTNAMTQMASDRAGAKINKLEKALAGLLGQVDAFMEREGEWDFETGEALAALGKSRVQKSYPLPRCSGCDGLIHAGECKTHNGPHEDTPPASGGGGLDAVVGRHTHGGNDGNLG